MRYVLRKDIKYRQLASKYEKRNKFIYAMLRVHKKFDMAFSYLKIFGSFSRNFLNRAKNRCKFTFSKHSIIRFYHVNRHSFRNCANFGSFFGLHKSSW